MDFLKAVKKQRGYIIIVLLFSLLIGCTNKPQKKKTTESEPNTLTETEKKDGWILLFDGKTFNNWRGLGREGIPEAHWKIEDGSIQKVESGEVPVQDDGQPLKGGDLMTIDTFKDFDLTFEWKISEAGNSGIKYNVSEEMSTSGGPSYAALGFEYQILDDEKQSNNLLPSQFSASLYDIIMAENTTLNPVGEFNTGRIIFCSNHCEHWLNGVKVVEFDIGSARFDSLFNISKYINIPDFPKKRSGHIVLQDHSDAVWFRNIKIRILDPIIEMSE